MVSDNDDALVPGSGIRACTGCLIIYFVVVAVIISALATQALLFGAAKGVGFGARLSVVLLFAVLAGLTAMGTATWIAGDYGSGFWTATALVMLAAAAVGAVVAGSARLLGPAGLGLAALVVVLFDLVSSGGPVGSQLLPDFYRWLAPWMPARSLYGSLRGALYFGGAGTLGAISLLAGWACRGRRPHEVGAGRGEDFRPRRARSRPPPCAGHGYEVDAGTAAAPERLCEATRLIGAAMLRYVVELEPLASASPKQLAAWLGPTVQRYLTEPHRTSHGGKSRRRKVN